MQKITAFGPATTREVAQEAEKLLSVLADAGIAVQYKGGRYTGANATLKFEFAVKGPNGEIVNAAAEAYKKYAQRFGLDPADLYREFQHGSGRRLRIVGLNPKATKNIVLLEDVQTKKAFVLPPEMLQFHLERPVNRKVQEAVVTK